MNIQSIEIITPVYNEEKYVSKFIKELVREIKKNKLIKRIIFINDGSTDNTSQIVNTYCKNNPSLILINLAKNHGKGYAMAKGFSISKKSRCDCVIFMDGDRQHRPRDIKFFIKKIHEVPVVFGYRHLSRNAPWVRKMGNKLATFLISKMFSVKRQDLLCGFIAFRKDVYRHLKWTSNGYGVEAEIATIISKKKLEFAEVFIPAIYFDRNKGINMKHALKILLLIPFWYFKK